MKTKEFDHYRNLSIQPRRPRRQADGPDLRSALLGVACVVCVFGVLTLLYHFG